MRVLNRHQQVHSLELAAGLAGKPEKKENLHGGNSSPQHAAKKRHLWTIDDTVCTLSYIFHCTIGNRTRSPFY